MTLTDQVAIVTGSARGQGRMHAVTLAGLGARVVVCDAPEPMNSVPYPLGTAEDLDQTLSMVHQAGSKGAAVQADVRRPEDVARVVDTAIGEFGQIDILVANAGIATQYKLWELSDEAWREMIDTNLTGVFHSVRAVVPHMRARRFGRIVITSSMGGRSGLPGMSHYSASKWGVIGLAKSLALEVAGEGITVNVVCPTNVRTPMVLNENIYRLFAPDVSQATEEVIGQRFRAMHPVPQPWVQPEDVSREVVHLVTEGGNITGAVVEIGLGLSARMH